MAPYSFYTKAFFMIWQSSSYETPTTVKFSQGVAVRSGFAVYLFLTFSVVTKDFQSDCMD